MKLTNRVRALRLDEIQREAEPLDVGKGLGKRASRSASAPRAIAPLLERRPSWSREQLDHYFPPQTPGSVPGFHKPPLEERDLPLQFIPLRPGVEPLLAHEQEGGNQSGDKQESHVHGSRSECSIAPAATASLARLGLVDLQRATVKVLSI